MIKFIGPRELLPTTEFEYSTVEECLEYFESHERVMGDCETTGLSHRENKIIALQLGDGIHQFVIDARHTDILLFKELLESKTIYGHNIGFDYKMLKAAGITLKSVYDTLVAETVLYCGYVNYGYGLGDLAMRYLNKMLDKSLGVDFTTIGSRPFTYQLIKYMADDVTDLFKIKELQDERADKFDLHRTIALENKALIPLANIEYNGMWLNQKKWLDYEKEAFKKLRELELVLDDALIEKNDRYNQPHTYKGKKGKEVLVPYMEDLFNMYSPERKTGINWNSDSQIKKVLKEEFDFEVKDKEGKITINSVILGKQKNKPVFVDRLIDYAEKAKEVSTYGVKFIEQNVQDDGRIRTSFWQVKDTGRVSSGGPNVQNIPEKHREFFEAGPGYKLIVCDYSQQEPRCLADYCQDEKLLEFVMNGDGDSHSLVASAVFSKIEGREIKVTKKDNPYSDRFKMTYRDVGKQINLGLDYGKTAFSIKDDLGVSQEEAQSFIDALKDAFPGKETFFKTKKEEYERLGYILHDYVCKRKTFVPDYEQLRNFNYNRASPMERKWFFQKKGSIERLCQNYPIQGTSASMTKLALIFIQEEIDKGEWDARLWNVVHDEVVVECREDQTEEFSKIMVKCMVRAGKVFCKTVPMKVEPEITKNWKK